MGFVYEKQKIRWKIIEQGVRGRACGSAREHAGIIFHAGAEADLTEHFEIVFRALLYAPRFNKLALALEKCDALVHFTLYFGKRRLALFRRCGIVRGGIYRIVGEAAEHFARHRVYLGDALYFVIKKFDSYRRFSRGGHYLEYIAADAEFVALGGDIVALIAYGDELSYQVVAIHFHAFAHGDDKRTVFLGVTERIYARNGSDDDDISALKKCRCGAVTQAVNLVIDGGIFFYI